MAKNQLSVVNPNELLPTAEAGLDDAGRINYYNELARKAGEISIRAAIGAGIELQLIKQRMPGAFVKWVQENCNFSTSTAYNYIALAGSLLSTRPANELNEEVYSADPAQRAEYVTRLSGEADGRSLSSLYSDYGIVKKSRMGGRRDGAGRKRKDSACLSMEERAEMATVELEGLVAQLGEYFQRRRHMFIADDQRRGACRKHLQDLVDLLQ